MIEYRFSSSPAPATVNSITADGIPTRIEGYAALFNVEAVIAGLFRERIAPGAFTAGLKQSEGLVRFNHSDDRLLGRTSAGTATIREDSRGLLYSVTVNPLDPLAVSVAAQVARGDVSGSSFAFTVDDDGEEWHAPKGRGDLPVRILWKLGLVDVAPVTRSAYPGTSASPRSFDGRVALANAKVRIQIAKARTPRQ